MPIKQYEDTDQPPGVNTGDDSDVHGYPNNPPNEGDDSGLRNATEPSGLNRGDDSQLRQASPGSLGRQEANPLSRGDDAGMRELSKIPALGGQVKGGDGASLGGTAAGLFKDQTPVGRRQKLAAFFKKNKKKTAATGVAGGVATLGILFVASWLPNHIAAYVNQLENRWMAGANSALEKEGEQLTSDYVKHQVIPSLGNCPSTRRDKSCVAPIKAGGNPVLGLYETFRVNNLENKWANDYGIELARDTSSGRIYMKVAGEKDVDLKDFVNGKYNNIFDMPEVSQSDVRRKFREAIQGESFAKRVMARQAMRKILAKYGIVRCIVACNTQDKLSTLSQNIETAIKIYGVKVVAKLIIAARVQDPTAQGFSLGMQCLFAGGCADMVDGENGEKVPKFQQQLTAQLKAYSKEFGKDKLDDLLKKYDGLLKDGYRSFLAQTVADKVIAARGGDAEQRAQAKELVNKAVVKGASAFGWATLVGQIISSLKGAGPALTAVRYSVLSTGAVATYTTLKSMSEEARAGQTDLKILGSMSSQLGPGAKDDGSGVGAEASPWFQAEFGATGVKASLLDGVFGSKAYAQGTTDQVPEPDKSTYRCDDGNPPAQGQKVCPEEVATGGVAFFTGVSNAIPGPLADLGGAVATVGGWLLAPFSGILSHIVPFSNVTEWLSARVQELMAWLGRQVMALPFGNMSGGRMSDMAMAGIDVMGNDAAHNLLGGQVASPAQARADYEQQHQREYEDFRAQPLMARIFDKESTFSLVSRLSLGMPNGFTAWQNTIASIMANPLGSVGSSLSSVFASNKVLAQTPAFPDPIGITQYYVPDNSPAFTDPRGPAQYWQDVCANGNYTKAWRENSAAHVNPLTGQAENPTGNPCMTIEGALEPYGALMGYGA